MQTKPKSKPAPNKRKIDWNHWRRLYIRGDQTITLEFLSTQQEAPQISGLKQRSAREDWPLLRAEFMHQVGTKTRALDLEVQEEVRKAVQDARRQHVKLGAIMIDLAAQGTAHIKVEDLGDLGVTRLARAGAEIQRKALGLEETTVNIRTVDDMKKYLRGLTDDDLGGLAQIATAETDSATDS